MNNILEIKNLTKSYNDFKLNKVNLEIPAGYIMGLIGPNGAGKTTIIKSIMNLIKPDSGKIKIFNKKLENNEENIKQNIGFVYENEYFDETLTGEKMKNIIKLFYKNWEDSKFYKYCEIFKLDTKKRIKELSKGMKRKLALAIAFSHNPKLVILDEPTSGLDPVFRNNLMKNLMEIIEDGEASILYSTHIISDLEKIGDYITYINNGNIVLSEEKDILLEKYKLIKGKNKYIEKLKPTLIAYKKSKYNFKAIIRCKPDKITQEYKEVIIEKPKLEDFMIILNKE